MPEKVDCRSLDQRPPQPAGRMRFPSQQKRTGQPRRGNDTMRSPSTDVSNLERMRITLCTVVTT